MQESAGRLEPRSNPTPEDWCVALLDGQDSRSDLKVIMGGSNNDSDSSGEDDVSLKEMIRTLIKDNRKAKKSADKNFGDLREQIKSVAEAVEPLKARMNIADEERGKLAEEVVSIKENLTGIRDDLKKLSEASTNSQALAKTAANPEFPMLGQASSVHNIFSTTAPTRSSAAASSAGSSTGPTSSDFIRTETPLGRAARTVSLFPILREEVEEIVKELKVTDDKTSEKDLKTKAMTIAAREFLNGEMRISHTDIDKLDIVGIFHGATSDWKTLYLEMNDKEHANWVLAHAGKLEKRFLSIGNHIPWQARERHEHFQKQALFFRKEENMKTRISICDNDYLLQFRPRGSNDAWTIWKPEDDAPPVSVSTKSAGPRISPTKAEGRKLRVELKGIKRILSPESTRRDEGSKRARAEEVIEDAPAEAMESDTEVFAITTDAGIFTNTQFIGTVNSRRASNISEFNTGDKSNSAATSQESLKNRPVRNKSVKS